MNANAIERHSALPWRRRALGGAGPSAAFDSAGNADPDVAVVTGIFLIPDTTLDVRFLGLPLIVTVRAEPSSGRRRATSTSERRLGAAFVAVAGQRQPAAGPLRTARPRPVLTLPACAP